MRMKKLSLQQQLFDFDFVQTFCPKPLSKSIPIHYFCAKKTCELSLPLVLHSSSSLKLHKCTHTHIHYTRITHKISCRVLIDTTRNSKMSCGSINCRKKKKYEENSLFFAIKKINATLLGQEIQTEKKKKTSI